MKVMNSRLKITILAKKCLHVLFALMLAFIIPVRTVAQDYYPVHATVQVLPPYSLYLSDYSNGFRDRLVITLYNRDLQQQTLDCRLRLRISNTSGFCIESRDEVPQRSITVEPNVPLRLTSQDIAPYLQTGNVKQTGTLRNGRLPEGMMTFSVQVVEQHTGRILSPWASGRAWLETKKPPMLVMPEKDETVAFTDPQHILFRWYPQHLGLSGVEYELHIRKMPDFCQNPAAQYDSGVEVFTTKTRQTLYNYSNIDLELIPGHTYAWKVRAVAMDGIDEVGVFDNDGYSEAGWFRLVRGCDAPVIDRAEAGYRKLDLGWHGSADDMRYTVQYSTEKENGSYNWKDTTTIDNETTLYGLTPGATYSYRVGALCSATGKPVYSQIGTVQIPNRDSISAANCGVAPVYKELSKERKTDLKVGDRVTVGGDYTMLITELNSKGNGVYGGKGRITFTWVFFVGLEVTFDDLVVNTDGYQIDGTVNTVYDGTNTNIANLDQLNDGGVNNRESRMSADGRSTLMNFSVPPMPRSDLSEDGGSVVVYDLSGAPHTIEIPSNGNGGQSIPFSLTDIDGNTWRFESCDSVVTDPATGGQKTVHGITMTKLDAVSGFSKDKLSDKVKARIAFMNGGQYAFDNLSGRYYSRSSKLGKDYLDKSGLGDGTYASWKLVPMGNSDKIKAGLNPTKIDIDIASVRFVDADGHDLESSYDSDNAVWTVNLTAAATEGNYYNVYAVAKPKDGKGSYQTIGKLFVVSYKTTKADIVLLPVEKHDGDISKLNAEISDIFAPCGVEISITESDALVGNTGWDLNGDGKLSLTNDAETDNVKRSAEMKALEDIVKSMPGYDKNVLYLVYVPKGSKSSGADVEGNWGRGRQIGYVFEKLEVRTVAHEVGHAFTLQHTFEKQYGGNETRGKTKNLMDYTDGTLLDAFQWEILAHNAPKIVASVVDGAEDNWFVDYAWLTPSGKPFKYAGARAVDYGSSGEFLDKTDGAIWGIVVSEENQKCYYSWSEEKQEYCNISNSDETLKITLIDEAKVDTICLLFPNLGQCGGYIKYSWTEYKNHGISNLENYKYKAVLCSEENKKVFIGDDALKAFEKDVCNAILDYQCKLLENDVYKIKQKMMYYVTTEDKLKSTDCISAFYKRVNIGKDNDVIWVWVTLNVKDGVLDQESLKIHYERSVNIQKSKNNNFFVEQVEKFLKDYNSAPIYLKMNPDYLKLLFIHHEAELCSNILETITFDESFWNSCDNAEWEKTETKVALYYFIRYCIHIQIESVMSGLINSIADKDMKEKLSGIWTKVSEEGIYKYEIPFYCGAYNGIIEIGKNAADMTAKLTSLGTSPEGLEQMITAFKFFDDMIIVDEKGDSIKNNWGKIWHLIKISLEDMVENECKVSYYTGNIVAPTLACLVGDYPALASAFGKMGNVAKSISNALNILSNIGDPTIFALKGAGCCLCWVCKKTGVTPYIVKGGKKIMQITEKCGLKKTGNDIEKGLEEKINKLWSEISKNGEIVKSLRKAIKNKEERLIPYKKRLKRLKGLCKKNEKSRDFNKWQQEIKEIEEKMKDIQNNIDKSKDFKDLKKAKEALKKAEDELKSLKKMSSLEGKIAKETVDGIKKEVSKKLIGVEEGVIFDKIRGICDNFLVNSWAFGCNSFLKVENNKYFFLKEDNGQESIVEVESENDIKVKSMTWMDVIISIDKLDASKVNIKFDDATYSLKVNKITIYN